ncbi:MAG: peptide chain release factor 2 [candidate division Zixibacteria bacterium]|nr:peptide chain release factor 2 [candidate division Zixibacteria bacterium]
MGTELDLAIEDIKKRVGKLGSIFDLEEREKKIAQLEKASLEPDFWNDNQKAQEVLKEVNSLKRWSEGWRGLSKKLEDVSILDQLATQEKDPQAAKEVEKNLADLKKELNDFEFQTLLSGQDDAKNAILSIHPGAGGTESQDWAQMLLRMYVRWVERKGYRHEVIDFQTGEEAGIKSATIEVTGDYAYGFLKGESGVHRLVRISPFDANKRRHTSFASIFVYPEIEDNITVEIKDDDLRVETFRASGAGGQHVNKVSSAVRMTHMPTGIVVQCQSERSQLRNKENALKVLKSRLYQFYKEKEDEKQEKLESQKKKIEWGSQIRSYVFHPYNMVKDHRTNVETGNAQTVMDGEIDEFIQAFLSQRKEVS